MALIERLTPGGNVYPDGSSTFAMLTQFFQRQAENRDTVDKLLRGQWEDADAVEATHRVAGDATTLASAKTDATAKANTAEANAKAHADTAAATAAATAEDNANAYTDVSFAAAAPGGATDETVDAAVDRAILGGRISTDDMVSDYVEDPASLTAAALSLRHAPRVPGILNLQQRGATGAGSVDNDVFAAAIIEAKNTRRPAWSGLINDPIGIKTIYLPAGDYRITDLDGLMGKESQAVKSRGLRFVGAGSDMTHIHFAPATPGPLVTNRMWNNIAFEGMTFTTGTAGSTFMHSISEDSAAVQEYTFTDVKWFGPWKYGFNLQGTNNNCEFRFFGCGTSGMADDGAFLFIGTDNTSDQFLNYWFYGFKHWSTGASLVDAARGGHFHFFGVDCSAWGRHLTETNHLFKLRGFTHSRGTLSMNVQALRVEGVGPLGALLYSEWPDGNVEIQCDWSSQTGFHTYGDIIHLNIGNTAGAIYNFHDSYLAGGVKVTYGSSANRFSQRIRFENCNWRQRLTPSEVVSYDESSAAGANSRPSVEFRNCRGVENQDGRDAAVGSAVWDATISYTRGPLVRPLQKRSMVVQGVYGSMYGTNTQTIHLPVGALITGMRAVSPPTSSGDSNGGTWRVHTTESTPALVAEVAVTTHMGNGYDVATNRTVPFHCDTRARATVTVSTQDTVQPQYAAFLTVEGYW